MDILGPLPTTQRGNRYILVFSDYFTHWAEAYSVPNQEAATVAKVFVDQWICQFGAPNVVNSDQGRNFESSLFQEICKSLDIKKTQTTPYHPQSDGLVERLNCTILMMLSMYVQEDESTLRFPSSRNYDGILG